MEARRIIVLINYHRQMLHNAKLMGAVSDVTLLEETIEALKELQRLKDDMAFLTPSGGLDKSP